jgi:hypothetical protein
MKKAKRKIIGARSAKDGKFVKKDRLKTEKDTTVAVTRKVEGKKSDG